jgi:hypothetical protein
LYPLGTVYVPFDAYGSTKIKNCEKKKKESMWRF